jgi:hypothetical protein
MSLFIYVRKCDKLDNLIDMYVRKAVIMKALGKYDREGVNNKNYE